MYYCFYINSLLIHSLSLPPLHIQYHYGTQQPYRYYITMLIDIHEEASYPIDCIGSPGGGEDRSSYCSLILLSTVASKSTASWRYLKAIYRSC